MQNVINILLKIDVTSMTSTLNASLAIICNASVLKLQKFVFICSCEYKLTLSSTQILLGFYEYELLEIGVYQKNFDTYALLRLTTRYMSKKSSCYDLVLVLHQKKKDSLNILFLRASQNDVSTSNCDFIAAFKAKWLFLAIYLEIICIFFTAKCENNAFENSDTFDGWLCDFLF